MLKEIVHLEQTQCEIGYQDTCPKNNVILFSQKHLVLPLAKEMQYFIFYTCVHACSASYTGRGIKNIAVDSETLCLWLVDYSFDVL